MLWIAIEDEIRHFLSSASVGLLVWLSIWITCCTAFGIDYRSPGTISQTPAARSISRFSWWLALAASFLVHCWQDKLL